MKDNVLCAPVFYYKFFTKLASKLGFAQYAGKMGRRCMKKQIELELLQVCGSPKLLGHKYTALLVYTLISKNMTTNYIYEGYQIVAEQYNVSAGSVERAINRYISAAWDLKRPELIAMFSEFRPSNKEFIAMFGVRIKIKLED